MRYEDFSVMIEAAADGGLIGRVLASPAGAAWEPLAPAAGALLAESERLRRSAAELGRAVRAVATRGAAGRDLEPAIGGGVAIAGGQDAAWLAAKEVGAALFKCLFTGEILNRFHESLGALRGPPERGLRIKLHLDISVPALLPLASLPWEFLYRATLNEFMSLNPRTPIVRHLEVPQPIQAAPLSPPLRVLVLKASPHGLPPLDLPRERSLLEAALTVDKTVELVFVEPPTTAALGRCLDGQPVHAFHFMGHGSFAGSRSGQLLFEDERGHPRTVSGEELATILGRAPYLSLAFLNACDTARVPRADGLDPFAGVATSLVLGGLPAAVAMQFPVSDSAAIAFSGSFYRGLASGMPIDEAVAAARSQLHDLDTRSLEWGTPALFLRAQDGRIFEVSAVPIAEKRTLEKLLEAAADSDLDCLAPPCEPDRGTTTQNTMERRESARRRLELASRSGGTTWIEQVEQIIRCRSPLLPFAGSFEDWLCSPAGGIWQIRNGSPLALGEVPDQAVPAPEGLGGCSLATWQGLRFHDGSIRARIDWSQLGGAGLALRHRASRTGVLALLRAHPDSGLTVELWQREESRFTVLATEPLAPATAYGLELEVCGETATVRVNGTAVTARLGADLAAGHAGLVHLAGAFARFHQLELRGRRRAGAGDDQRT